MKQLCFSIATIAVFNSAVFTSCKKDVPLKKKTTLEEIQLIGKKHNVHSSQFSRKEPSAGRAVAADACGALSGCMSPFTAIFGACAASVYDLYQQGAFGMVLSGSDEGTTNPNNPYDNLGLFHNKTIIAFAENSSEESELSENLLKNFIFDKYANDFSQEPTPDEVTFIENHNFMELHETLVATGYSNSGIGGVVENHRDAGYINEVETDILLSYFSNLTNSSTLSEGQAYSIECENVIVASDLPFESKQKLLISMCVARNSFTLYFAKGIK